MNSLAEEVHLSIFVFRRSFPEWTQARPCRYTASLSFFRESFPGEKGFITADHPLPRFLHAELSRAYETEID